MEGDNTEGSVDMWRTLWKPHWDLLDIAVCCSVGGVCSESAAQTRQQDCKMARGLHAAMIHATEFLPCVSTVSVCQSSTFITRLVYTAGRSCQCNSALVSWLCVKLEEDCPGWT